MANKLLYTANMAVDNFQHQNLGISSLRSPGDSLTLFAHPNTSLRFAREVFFLKFFFRLVTLLRRAL